MALVPFVVHCRLFGEMFCPANCIHFPGTPAVTTTASGCSSPGFREFRYRPIAVLLCNCERQTRGDIMLKRGHYDVAKACIN